MIYQQATAFLLLILKADVNGTSLCINGAHDIHDIHVNMKGHSGVNVTMGIRAMYYASSTKSKINTSSSTEIEVISVGEK